MIFVRVVALAALCVSSASMAQRESGGFGIKMGQPISTLKILKQSDALNYIVSVPTPNAEFDSYMVRATRGGGVCRVSGLGQTHENDSYGTETKGVFAKLRDILTSRYGPGKDYDFLNVGSIWKDGRDYFMSILKNERSLTTFWSDANGSSMPSDIQSIMLDTRAVSSGLYVVVSYEFANMDQCIAAAKDKDGAGL